MRYRETYSLYRRKTKEGFVWYYRTYDEDGIRTSGRSTGQTSKTLARRHCDEMFRKGTLVPATEIRFADYASDWWDWDRCSYVRFKIASNQSDKPAISKRYVDGNRRILENHILPFFANHRLSGIRPKLIQSFMFHLQDQGLSNKRINDIAGSLKIMFQEAVNNGYLHVNPFDRVRRFAVSKPRQDILTVEEAKELFAASNIIPIWNGHHLHRSINMLAASTGMRQGEILALRE